MQRISDSTHVSLLSIPGTHDTATYAAKTDQYRRSSQCQSWNTYEQLKAGIRFLDLRIRAEEQLKMAHGQLITFGPFSEEVAHIERFLKQNPS